MLWFSRILAFGVLESWALFACDPICYPTRQTAVSDQIQAMQRSACPASYSGVGVWAAGDGSVVAHAPRGSRRLGQNGAETSALDHWILVIVGGLGTAAICRRGCQLISRVLVTGTSIVTMLCLPPLWPVVSVGFRHVTVAISN